MTYVGKAVPRQDDLRFVTGHGFFVDDVSLPDVTYAVFVRSPHAHARIVKTKVEAALSSKGVLAVLTGQDWLQDGLGELPSVFPVKFSDGRPMNVALRQALAVDRVRHIGEAVAVVIAETKNLAMSAAEIVQVEYERLPSNSDIKFALDAATPILHDHLGTNLQLERHIGNRQAVEEALANAAHVASIEIRSNRLAPSPIEPRACVGHYDSFLDRYTFWVTAQAPHLVRTWLAESSLRIPEHKIRVVAPDVGGGFGVKLYHYPEDPVVLWASRRVRRPVRWTATRSESFLSDIQARDHYTTARMGFDKTGKIVGLYVETIAAAGAYESTVAASISAGAYPSVMAGPYSNRNVYIWLRTGYTNTVPIDAYRGAGHSEAIAVYERLLEMGAHALQLDPIEVRKRNLIANDQFPYHSPTGAIYDSGNFPGLLNKLVQLSKYQALRKQQTILRKQGVLMGIGTAAFVENNGGGMSSRRITSLGSKHGCWEVATVRVHPSGDITIFAGTHSHGQSHATVYAQIAADYLGCAIEDIDVVEGDTDRIPFGNGTWGARSIATCGPAVKMASERIVNKGRKLAAHLLQCSEDEIDFGDGRYLVRHSNRGMTFREVAHAAYAAFDYPNTGFEVGLEATVFYDPPMQPSPAAPTSSAMHMAVVLVDPETGLVKVRDYFSVDDCGTVINPMLVEGQIHGALAQGLGEALLENVHYDANGQLTTGSFLDYAMPRSCHFPTPKLVGQVTLAPGNPLGAKGVGESGIRGPAAAIVNAVVDACWHLGVRHIERPVTSQRVWEALRAAKKESSTTTTANFIKSHEQRSEQ
jgi:carbon-monoxide dehydrogenase large subunit